MVDYTLGVSCGYLCGCGTLKLELLRKNDIYKQSSIYVAIPCLNVLLKDFKKAKKWTLYKLPIYVDQCYFTEVPMNKFDTKGVAFYA